MKKNKYIYFLFSLIVLFSFNIGVKARNADEHFTEGQTTVVTTADILNVQTDYGKGKKCSSLNLEKKWLKDPTGMYKAYMYYYDDADGNCLIEQISYDGNMNVNTYSSLETWSNKNDIVINHLTADDKKKYDINTLTATPTLYITKKEKQWQWSSFKSMDEYNFSYSKEHGQASLTMKVASTYNNSSAVQKTCSNDWLKPLDTNYPYTCLYRLIDQGKCVKVQFAFDPNTKYTAISNIDEKIVATWNNVKEENVKGKLNVSLFGSEQDIIQKEIYRNNFTCPKAIYFSENPSKYNTQILSYNYIVSLNSNNYGVEKKEMNLINYDYPSSSLINGDVEMKTCEEVLGEDLIAILQDAVNIVKVAIPILLIVLGTMDFGMAIFSSDENKMKDAQGKFIKRLIIAAAIFLIPSLLGVILDIANSIWGNIDTTLCGIEF